jgi:hypothetical protein
MRRYRQFVLARLKPFLVPILIAAFAATIYVVRIHENMVDFDVYRQAAERALHGENLYRAEDGHYQYKYWPAFAFAMAPFALLAQPAARLFWYGLSFGFLCLFVRWSAVALPERRLSTGWLTAITVLVMAKFYGHELNLGQSNLLFGTTLVAAFLACEIEARRLAGALVAVAMFVKPYAIVLVPWAWLAAGASGAATGLVVLTAGLFLPAFAFGWQGNLDQLAAWYRTVTVTTGPLLIGTDNASFAATWAKWIGIGTAASVAAFATSAVAIGAIAWMMAVRRRVAEPSFLEFAALLLLIPLLSPQGWDYVLLLATPAVIVTIDRWRECPLPWRAVSAFAMAGLGLTLYDVLGRTMYERAMSYNFMTVCAVLLFSSLVNLRLRKLA